MMEEKNENKSGGYYSIHVIDLIFYVTHSKSDLIDQIYESITIQEIQIIALACNTKPNSNHFSSTKNNNNRSIGFFMTHFECFSHIIMKGQLSQEI